jgi:apolipoprotein N-acyltransferase
VSPAVRAALAVAGGLAMAMALPQAFPWLSLREVDPAGHLEVLAWGALVPVLLAVGPSRGLRGAAAVGLAAGLAYFYGAIWWVNHAMTAFGGLGLGLSLVALSLLVLYMAAHWAAALALSWWIRRRLGWPWWAHLPAAWVAAEWLRNYLLTGFPWGNLGYTQARNLAVAQLAAAAGPYGIAALVAFVNAALAEVAEAGLARRPVPWRPAAAAAALVALAAAGGAARIAWLRGRIAAAPRLAVALVQPNVDQAMKNDARTHAEEILGRLAPLTAEADRRGADLVAWPEASYPWALPPRIATLDQPGAGVPRLRRAHLLLGAGTWERRRLPSGALESETSNSVFLLRPDLTVAGRYRKHHLVPFGEYVPLRRWLPFLRSVVPTMAPQIPGSALEVLRFPAPEGGAPVSLAPMICFDAIFPEVNVAYAAQDPEILVNPTNDAWYGYSSGPYQFLAMVRLRAIEAGKAVARPAYAGVSALILPTGEVLPGALPVGPVDPELAPDPREPPRLLLGELPRLRGRTLYTRFGDLFAALATAWAAAVAVLAWRRRGGGSR